MNRKLPCLLIWAFLFGPVSSFSADTPPPAGSSAEVIQKKILEESREKILEQEEPEEQSVDFESPQAPQEEGVSFYAKDIQVKGSELIDAAELHKLLSQYEEREVSFKDLSVLGKAIEQLYREKGYLASVFVPAQKIKEGSVTLQVVIYRMGELRIEGQKWGWKWKLRSYWRIPKSQPLRFDQVQQSLIGMNENPDRTVRSYLKPSAEPGALDILLKVDDRFPIHGGFSFDNQGAKLTGKRRKGFTVRHNNMLGLDDTFFIGTSFGHSFGAIFLQHLIPVNSYGTRFLWGYTHSQVDPQKEFAPFGINGTSEIYSLAIRQKIFRTRRSYLDVYLGYDFKEKRTKQLSVTSVWDKLRVLSFGGDYQHLDRHGSWSLGQKINFGLPFRTDGYSLTSRNAESSFVKYGFELERIQKLFWGTRALAHLEGQLTPDKLPPQEQFFLGGLDSVRGYADNDYGADQGILLRLEYQVPFFIVPKEWKLPYATESLRDAIEMIGFSDYGHGFLRGASSEEHRERTLLGVGSGFRIKFQKNISGLFEWGVPLGDNGLIESGRSQFHFKLQTDV